MSRFSSFFIVLASVILATHVVCRPIYNIAHMVNAVKQIDEYLEYGANALEADVTFSRTGLPEYFYHGFPCDFDRYCNRWAYIGNYINALRERTLPGSPKFNSRLVLFMFDVKLGKLKDPNVLFEAGKKFVDKILIPLYKDNPTKMKVMLSVPKLSMKSFISGVLKTLKTKQPDIIEKIGFDISFDKNKTSYSKEKELRALGVSPGHAWLTSGNTNWVGYKYLKELREQVKYKNHGNFFSKVYAWTVDQISTAKEYLNINVNGIIVNYPGNMNRAMDQVNKENGAKVRLATLDDDPFQK